MTEYELAVRIAGKVDKTFNTSLKNTDSDLKKFVTKWDNAYTKLDAGYDKILNVGTAAFKAVAVTATAAATAAVTVGVAASKAGMEFESAFAGVRKTVKATEEEFGALRQDILDMSIDTPSAAVDIAGVMEVAGQLSIANEYLTDFTEVMIKLGVSTNMAAEEAATNLAKFANITGMDPTNYENLGSVIVDLGNNFATTEADIVEMATRLAATGELAGLSEAQIMALATAMSSVGIEAESGGSTMSKLLKKMQVAVETESDALKDFASVAGMTAEEFSAVFEKDAVVALSAFIGGLSEAEKNGSSAIVTLDKMGLKEIRLSNTILSLANANDLMTKAIEMANKAWGENTALAKEAEERYKTTESKLTMLKNAVDVLFIESFDEIQGPLQEGIDWLKDSVVELTEYATGPNGLSKWANDLKTDLPIMTKNAKKFGSTVLDFAEPLVDAGKWLVKNPDYLATGFVALGGVLASYKIASTVSSVVTGVLTLASNPVMLGIVAMTAAFGGIAGAVYKSKKNFEELVDLKLEKSFGDIALSLEDIQNVADYLVDDGSLVALREALGEFDELEDFQTIINDAVAELRKANWKVSIGMELTEEEQTEYQKNIDEFVKGCNDYVLQQQYAIGLAFNVLSDESMNESNIGAKINQFYSEQQAELQGLGKELADLVTDTFSEEVLDPKKITQIANIQAKMAEIQNKLADAEFEANLISIGKEYDLTNLDSNSFQALQAELNEKLEQATAQYEEAREQLLANAVLMRNEGKLTDAEFEVRSNEIQDDYLTKVSELQTKATKLLLSGILDGRMISDMMEYTVEEAAASLEKHMDTDDSGSMYFWYDNPYLKWNDTVKDMSMDEFESTAAAVEELLSNMSGILGLLEQTENYFTSRNLPVPENILEINKMLEDIEMLTDVNEVRNAAIGAVIRSDSDYLEAVEKIQQRNQETALELGYDVGYYIPLGIIDGMNANYSIVTQRMTEIYDEASALAAEEVAKAFEFKYGKLPFLPELKFPSGVQIPGHADGGIFTEPHIAAFAEKGPESAIPLDGSQNAINLWKATGRLLGMKSVLDGVDIGGGGEPHIEYKPQLVFNGGTPTQSDIQAALKISQDEFGAMMRQWLKENARVAF